MPSKQGETTSIRATDGESIKHGANALKIVPALTARTQLGQILRRVRQNQERFVVNKRGEPQAVIMSVEEYVRNFARQPTALAQIQREAKSKKPNVLPLREINLEINRYRRRAVFPMLRAVLDTSVVISARLSPEGQQALILGLAIAQYFRCFVSDALREEYEGVLRRERFGLSPGSVTQSMRIIRKWATLVIPNRKLDVSRDPDARADYIVTGNTRHFPSRFQDIRIVLPRQFLTLVAAQPGCPTIMKSSVPAGLGEGMMAYGLEVGIGRNRAELARNPRPEHLIALSK